MVLYKFINMYIFSDVSVEPKSKKGIGCYIIMNDLNELLNQENIVCLEFYNTSSTIAELKTIEHILNQIELKYDNFSKYPNITMYTDCKTFLNLINKRQHKVKLQNHRNYDWYQKIICSVNKFNINIIWVKGHSKQKDKPEIYQKHFSVIDDYSRSILRNLITCPK
jgi:ribonuclease HI